MTKCKFRNEVQFTFFPQDGRTVHADSYRCAIFSFSDYTGEYLEARRPPNDRLGDDPSPHSIIGAYFDATVVNQRQEGEDVKVTWKSKSRIFRHALHSIGCY